LFLLGIESLPRTAQAGQYFPKINVFFCVLLFFYFNFLFIFIFLGILNHYLKKGWRYQNEHGSIRSSSAPIFRHTVSNRLMEESVGAKLYSLCRIVIYLLGIVLISLATFTFMFVERIEVLKYDQKLAVEPSTFFGSTITSKTPAIF